MIMQWPQITVVVLAAISLGIHMAKHGQPALYQYSAPIRLVAVAIYFWLLYEGGFFGAL